MINKRKNIIKIAIDSPAAAGAGTVAKAISKNYNLFQASSQTTIGNQGCNLYVGGAGNITVVTIGQDVITFNAVIVGSVLPIQIIKLLSTGTTATLVNALW